MNDQNLKIVNAMFGKKKGGIEQAFIDYSHALAKMGHKVTVLTFPDAEVGSLLGSHENITHKTIANFGQWDPIASWKIKNLTREANPDIIVTHGNRATTLFTKALSGEYPIVGVCHNYNFKHMMQCDGLITVTDDLRRNIIKKGFDNKHIYHVPNMINIPSNATERKDFTYHTPPVVGTMARFVAKKGVDVFINALAILKARKVEFKAVIAGEGEEEKTLLKMVNEKNLQDYVQFLGWVNNKDEFYKSLDIFCVPSLHEPFGIVLLESFLHQIPVITSDAEGPIEVARPYHDCLMVPKGDPRSLSTAIEKLIIEPQLAARIAKQGYSTVNTRFNSETIAKSITEVLLKVCTKFVKTPSSNNQSASNN